MNRLPLVLAAAVVLPLVLVTPASAAPAAPRLSSTDFPGGEEPVIPQRTIGTITARPAPGDTSVRAYRFSFDGIRWRVVQAGPDGSAVIPVTLYDHSSYFRVAALDAEGRSGPNTTWDLAALDNTAPAAHVRGDVNGDGRGDLLVVHDRGEGRTTLTNLYGGADGFHTPVTVWDSGRVLGTPPVSRWVRGDLNGDGRTDLAMLRQGSDGRVSLYPTLSDDHNGYGSFSATWTSPEPWSLNDVQLASGDFDGDGKGDVAVLRGQQVYVSPGGAAPSVWLSGVAEGSRIVGGDFDGDGRADLAVLRATGDCRTSLVTHRSAGGAFAAGEQRWELDGQRLASTSYASGDFDGDGRADLLALSDRGDGQSAVLGLRASAGFLPTEDWRGAVPASAVLDVGDHNADGRADLALVANDGEGRTRVWSFVSTGTSESPHMQFLTRIAPGQVVRHVS